MIDVINEIERQQRIIENCKELFRQNADHLDYEALFQKLDNMSGISLQTKSNIRGFLEGIKPTGGTTK